MGSVPNWIYQGDVGTPQQWIAAFQGKQDDLGLSLATIVALASGLIPQVFGGTITITMAGGATSYTLTDSRIIVASRLKLGLPYSQGAASILPQLWKSAQSAGSITLGYDNDGTSNSYTFDYEITI